MELYAIKINKTHANLIARLNDGVVPEVESKSTYFVFDAAPDSEVHNEILTERDLYNRYEISTRSPLVLRLKK